jgi:hypothetical protein
MINKIFLFTLSVFVLLSCKKDKIEDISDAELLSLAKDTTGFVWFKNEDSLFAKSSGSGHSFVYLKTRYNNIAKSQLGIDGKVLPNAVFPEGSLIVKELFSDSNTLSRYAILYKKSSSNFADEKGWIWGYVNSDGSVAEAASKKGASCISCHSQNGQIDYQLMNKFYP